ncbi:VWA domain-containing protein [Chryseolinea sp. H1M3-3]|uniref:vWA domain-containing protein n=1 Tax=Chryseolinea sp. H1M3-3 TaxID=3034144 RepID=UPI0023ED98CA|nr:VWA domain-containing protein [Chryseolinea sp. H1M3-3]
MRLLIPFLLFQIPILSTAQISAVQQKALNSYVEYANRSAEEVEAVVKSIISYYPTIHQKQSWGAPRYTCPIQLEDYFLNEARKQSKGLSPVLSTALNTKLNELRDEAEQVDAKCKALDTYHKLEDYKQDNFAKAITIINELQLLVIDYRKKQAALQSELETGYKKLTAASTQNANHKADAMMRAQVAKEKVFIDSWSFNIKEEIHTGWSVELLQQSILETDAQLSALQKFKPVLQYPASSMWTSFQSSLSSVLSAKRAGLDEYNFEAKKSDKHTNDVYLELINYYNGTLVSDYNTFIQFAQQNGYYGLKLIKYVPAFEIRTAAKVVEVDVKKFKDIPRSAISIAPIKTAIPKTVYQSLSNYVDFINETWSQTRRLQSILSSFNSTASYYKTLETYNRTGGMSFNYEDFQLPLSQYQKTLSDSKALPPSISKSLNEQTEVVLNILKEMDDLSASLEIETSEKRYEKDHLKKVYEILERQKVLFEVWDERKELLYEDVRKVYDAYAISTPANPWYVSGKALRQLTDLDHEGVFTAKASYKRGEFNPISTEKIDGSLREVISKEYENMKGIQKIGRNNGLCPYTPYEDLPATSKSLSEALKKVKPSNASRYQHPYYSVIYHYNDIVDDYNKFCELSKEVLLLKTVKQPELFQVQYPDAKPEKETASQRSGALPNEHKEVSAVVTSTPTVERPKEAEHAEKKTDVSQEPPVRVVEKTKVVHDTVYVERRDTVYISEPGENLRSMEGYATNNMILLLDVSGSMNAPEKLPLLKKSVLDLLAMMRPEDRVSIIAFSGKPKALLESVSFKDEQKIKNAINELKSSGKTDGNAGVKLAYKVADENYIRGGNNRIILATDGEFGLNDETRQLIEKFSKDDIFLTVFNFGKGVGASKALERLAKLGKGNYRYISKSNVDLQLIGEAKAKKKK